MNFNDEYLKLRKKRIEEQQKQSTSNSKDIGPVRSDADSSNNGNGYFKKPAAFDDGYQLFDVFKSYSASAQDLNENITSGVLGMGEKVVDAGAAIIGGIGGLFGANDFKNNMQKFVAKDLYDEKKLAKTFTLGGGPLAPTSIANRILGGDSENDSVFDEQVDSMAQSGGQLAATFALSTLGVPWYLTTGATSYGSAFEGASREGATFEEATLYSAISTAAEIITEKLFGGSGLGEKGLINVEALTKGISNKLVKSLVDYGIDITTEGAEETIASIAEKLASSIYKEENVLEILTSEEALNEYLNSFIGGAVLGGAMNTGKVAKSVKSGRDYRMGLTDNEQKVFDSVYNKRLAEAKKNGQELTSKEKKALYDSVLDEVKKGYISTDDIESVLGGKEYEAYKSILEQEKPLREEISSIENNDTLTDEQKETLKQTVVAKLETLATETNKAQARENLDKTIQNQLVRQKGKNTQTDDYLIESYNEQARRYQAFEADLSQYDEKTAKTVKKAIDSGILNNTRKTHKLVDWIAKISSEKGVDFDFTNNQKLKESGFSKQNAIVNGYVTKDGIIININSQKALNTVVGHEITHVLEGTELYAEMQSALFEYAKSKNDYDSRRKSLEELYKNIKDADIDAELTADLVGDYLFTDQDFINNLSTNHRNVFQKIYDEIKYLLKVATAGSKEARELEKVKRAFDKAYRANGNTSEGTKYSLSDSDGKKLTKEQSEYFKDSKMRDDNGDVIPLSERFNANDNDIRYSLSAEGETPKRYGNYNVYGEDIGVKSKVEDIGPVREDISPKKATNIAPTNEAIANNATTTDTTLKDLELQHKLAKEKYNKANRSNNTEDIRRYSEELVELEQKIAQAEADQYAPPEEEIAPIAENIIVNEPVVDAPISSDDTSNKNQSVKTVKDKLKLQFDASYDELVNNKKLYRQALKRYDDDIAALQKEYESKKNKNTRVANDILRRVERLKRMRANVDADYKKRINDNRERLENIKAKLAQKQAQKTRAEVHAKIMDNIKAKFAEKGFDFDEVLKKAKNRPTLATVDNTPQREMEKTLGYKAGQILADETINKVAENETEGIKWLNSFTDRKNGVLAQLSKKYNIKPGSKESAAAQMYAEGFYVAENGDIYGYDDRNLAQDFPDLKVQENIKGLAKDPIIRRIYDDTLKAINESRVRNAYPEIPRLDNYFLHFRAMDDTFSRLGVPFNPNDIRAKDLPTDLNGVTANLKPGQPYFSSAKHREGKRTSFDLIGGLEKYLTSAKNQIYHIDDIQTFRALRNYIAGDFGQAHGLEGLDELSAKEAHERIEQVYGSHLSNFAKFLNEEANILAGKTSLADRALEGIIGRRGVTFLDTLNKQVGANMVGFNVSSSLTNFLSGVQAIAKTNKLSCIKAFAQTVSSKINALKGKTDSFVEDNPTIIRRNGAERFYRTPFQKFTDAGYILAGAVDNVTTEFIVRAKYDEFIQKGMSEEQAIKEADKWTSRLMGDRSLGQMPQLYNSKMLGLVTKFQLEVRNQLDSQFYDTIQEINASNEDIKNGLERNAKTAAKVTATLFELAVLQHLFGKAFESVAGYNPAFDIIDVLIKTFGLDDDEEDEDTILDNVEEGFLTLLDDLPYTSTFTGGRIPISSTLPIKEIITGKDQYGNEKSRLETLSEAAPYYVIPGGYGQAKKTVQGLKMFDDDYPISGSYTDSGKLRFPVDDTIGNRVQAAIFGQYANKNARDYFDNDYAPLNDKQIQEYKYFGKVIRDYSKYVNDLKGIKSDKNEDGESISGSRKKKVIEYINNLDIDYGAKLILYKSEYPSDNKYNHDIIAYLNDKEDISYNDMETILTELGFIVSADGKIRWE